MQDRFWDGQIVRLTARLRFNVVEYETGERLIVEYEDGAPALWCRDLAGNHVAVWRTEIAAKRNDWEADLELQ